MSFLDKLRDAVETTLLGNPTADELPVVPQKSDDDEEES